MKKSLALILLSTVGAMALSAAGDLLSLFWANAGTLFGAACFFVAALLARPARAPASAGARAT